MVIKQNEFENYCKTALNTILTVEKHYVNFLSQVRKWISIGICRGPLCVQ